jgi:glycosyltransferase involved in cell wall biosynthesis
MRIAINALHITRGVGLVHLNKIIEWFGRLAPKAEFILLGKQGQENQFIPSPTNFKYVFYEFPVKKFATYRLWERDSIPGILKEMKASLLFEPGNRGTLKPPCPKVALIYNIGPFDDDFRDGEGFHSRMRLNTLQNATIQNIKASDGAIFISEYSRRIFFQYINRAQINTKVIYHGKLEDSERCPDDGVFARLKIDRPYLLCVSDIRRHKKIMELINSYTLALTRRVDIPPLVVTGAIRSQEYFTEIKKIIEWSGQTEKIIFTEQLPNPEVLALYRNCQAFLFPSILESFPDILVEALASGCPVATAKRGVMSEIAGNAALFFDPDNIEEFSSKIIALVKDDTLRYNLGQKAIERARFFSWEKTARQTLEFFDETIRVNSSGLSKSGQKTPQPFDKNELVRTPKF